MNRRCHQIATFWKVQSGKIFKFLYADITRNSQLIICPSVLSCGEYPQPYNPTLERNLLALCKIDLKIQYFQLQNTLFTLFTFNGE
jgi:hypothetical protein